MISRIFSRFMRLGDLESSFLASILSDLEDSSSRDSFSSTTDPMGGGSSGISDKDRKSPLHVAPPNVHGARDEAARAEERRGVIEFHVIGNSLNHTPSRQTVLWLIGMQNVFSHQVRKIDRSFVSGLCIVTVKSDVAASYELRA